MLFNSGAKLKMNDTVIKVICVCFVLNLNLCLATPTTTEATDTTTIVDDDSAKNLTVRSINDDATSDDAPLRINLAGEFLRAHTDQYRVISITTLRPLIITIIIIIIVIFIFAQTRTRTTHAPIISDRRNVKAKKKKKTTKSRLFLVQCNLTTCLRI